MESRWIWMAAGLALILFVCGAWPRPIICDGSRVGQQSKARMDLTTIAAELDVYAVNNDRQYPTSLQVLVTPDENGHCYLEGYNGKIPCDPWKREYLYSMPTPSHPRPIVYSFGADGKPGGSDDDADVSTDTLVD